MKILCKKEPECWYVTSETASFLVNGNRSHAHVPLSQMELKDLTEIIRTL